MKKQEPKQVILEQLRLFEQYPSDFETLVREQSYFLKPIKYKARLPYGVKIETVHFLKERSIPGYCVYAMKFEDGATLTWTLLCLVAQDSDGNWAVRGCSGSVGNTPISRRFSPRPSVLLSGDSEDWFYAGGFMVDDTRLDIAKVRLLSQGELIGEDTVQDGLVVFVSSKNVEMPVESEYYNQSGVCVDSHQVSFTE